MHIGHDACDLIGEEVGQSKQERDTECGGAHVGHDELPEWQTRNSRRQKRSGAESHDKPRCDDRLHHMLSIRRPQPLLTLERQYQPHPAPVQDVLTPVSTDPVEHHIAGEHAQKADGKRKPPPDDTLVAQDGGRDDGHLLWDWHAQAAKQEHGKNAEVREVSDESLECLHGASPIPDSTVLRANLSLGHHRPWHPPASDAQSGRNEAINVLGRTARYGPASFIAAARRAALPVHHAGSSETPSQEQDEEDQENQAQPPAWEVPPVPAVRPPRKCPDNE